MAKINFFQGQSNLFEQNNSQSDTNNVEEIRKRIMEFFNVKNIHFLFGSGTSCNAIPNMKGLFDEVDGLVSTLGGDILEEFNLIGSRIERQDNLEDILGVLYSNRIYLENYSQKERENSTCKKLIDIIETAIFSKINIDFETPKAKEVLETYRNFYNKLALRNSDLKVNFCHL